MLSTLAGPLDLFSTAGMFWPMLMGRPADPLFEVQLVSPSQQPMQFAGGLTIRPQCDLEQSGQADVVYVPSLQLMPGAPLPASVDHTTEWLRQQHANGALLCSACTGSFVLAQTGLLNDVPATTHWAFGQQFQTSFPRVQHKNNAVLIVNEDARIMTAGANASWQDLILHVIERFTSQSVADETRRMFLIDRHETNQGAYSLCNLQVTTADNEIGQAQKWLQAHLNQAQPVEHVIERSELSSRTFKRRFKKHVGLSVIAYVQLLRVDAAKNLLLTSQNSIDEIAFAVGYQDVSYFRRIFVRETGINPSAYRQKFREWRA